MWDRVIFFFVDFEVGIGQDMEVGKEKGEDGDEIEAVGREEKGKEKKKKKK